MASKCLVRNVAMLRTTRPMPTAVSRFSNGTRLTPIFYRSYARQRPSRPEPKSKAKQDLSDPEEYGRFLNKLGVDIEAKRRALTAEQRRTSGEDPTDGESSYVENWKQDVFEEMQACRFDQDNVIMEMELVKEKDKTDTTELLRLRKTMGILESEMDAEAEFLNNSMTAIEKAAEGPTNTAFTTSESVEERVKIIVEALSASTEVRTLLQKNVSLADSALLQGHVKFKRFDERRRENAFWTMLGWALKGAAWIAKFLLQVRRRTSQQGVNSDIRELEQHDVFEHWKVISMEATLLCAG